MIIKNRSRGVKLVIKYNPDGFYVGQVSMHLTIFLGVLARTMVPIRYNNQRDVPIQVKNNLWDTIEVKQFFRYIIFFSNSVYEIFLITNNYVNNLQASFTLDSKSRRNCMLTMGKCFQSFKNMLTVKYVIPFKDQQEVLKKPPIEYIFIEDEDWTIFVKERFSKRFQVNLNSSSCLILTFTFTKYKIKFVGFQRSLKTKKEEAYLQSSSQQEAICWS